MAEKLVMLALSPTMEVGTISRWIKHEGDTIASGDVVCEVETDKAVMEYESIQEGVLLKILQPASSEVAVGDPIAIIGESGEDVSAMLEAQPGPKSEKPAPSERASAELAAPVADAPQTPSATTAGTRIKASPVARKIAHQRGLDLADIKGSGPKGRITKKDVESAPSPRHTAPPRGPAAPADPKSQTSDERIPLSRKRKIIAERLAESKFSAPHYYLRRSAHAGLLLDSRHRMNEHLNDKISFNAIIMKLVASALMRHPEVNSGWDGDAILRFHAAHVGLAVALPDGLITVVVRDVQTKGLEAIESDLKNLIERARSQRLTPEEMTGATFTISNLGSFGIEEFTAIINPPGSAILALGRILKKPVVIETPQGDDMAFRRTMAMTLSCDHRVIDGAVGAAFLADLTAMIEDPLRALI